VDGCNHNYADPSGKRNFCVPRAAPLGRTLDCTFLRDVGVAPLKVVGVDDLQLAGGGRSAARNEVVCAG
jgi:hypothetical protein